MERIRSIVLASHNPGKLREIRQALGAMALRVAALEEFGQVEEAAETGSTFAENARRKALHYAGATGQWCLADDSGLVVDALGGEPGVRSARYAGADGPREAVDAANNRRLLTELADVPDPQRTARFVCHLALADGERVLIEASGAVEGRILRGPRGQNGFGYDPLFLLPELGQTAAELAAEEKNRISHRGRAVRRFAKLLGEFLTAV